MRIALASFAIIASCFVACSSDDTSASPGGGASSQGGQAAAGASSQGGESAAGGSSQGGAQASGGAASGGEAAGGEAAGGGAAGGEAAGGGAAGGESAAGGASGGGGQFGPIEDFMTSGERKTKVYIPEGYDPAKPTPLLILLHGYGASGSLQDLLFGLGNKAYARGLVFAKPDGVFDDTGKRFWAANDTCCGVTNDKPDDVAYLTGIIDEIVSKVNIDPKRIYFAGHSNGGFMSYRMACDKADRVAAIVSLAGAGLANPDDCKASEPVSVLQMHGDQDETVSYAGGTIFGFGYPSALDSVKPWAARGGCADALTLRPERLDLDNAVPGDETREEYFDGCSGGVGVELWTLEGSKHIPGIKAPFADKVIDFLLAHPKQ